MKSHILLQTAVVFFLSKLYLKQGIGLLYVMVDFICKCYLELAGTRVARELQNEKFLPTLGIEPGTVRWRSENPREDAGGLSREYVLRIHSMS